MLTAGWVSVDPVPLAHGAGGTAGAGGGGWPAVLTAVLVCGLAAAYGRGIHELWGRRGVGAVVPRWRVAAFATGLVALLASESPLVLPVAERSFAGHMGQHMVLLVVAGPLLAAGAVGLPLLVASPAAVRRRLARLRASGPVRWARRPVTLAIVAGALHTVVLWSWHFPGLYVAAVDSAAVHLAEHGSFLLAAWLLWSTVVGAGGQVRGSGPLVLGATGMPAAALGAVLVFTPARLYPERVLAAADPLRDQQLAGLVMWVPMDVVAAAVAVALFVRWLARLDRAIPAGRDVLPAEEVRA